MREVAVQAGKYRIQALNRLPCHS